MNRFVCIHGHFYQPPRENPWLEDIELQDSAYPFHDWNERITAECYEPNTASRILDREEQIVAIVNNYERISFNFGPTLLSWLERHRGRTYQAILEADRRSRERFSGHGAALAQAYNHLIMPLASRRDKQTQVRWGVADFVHRFGREPEGMWLPETAVDLETLEVLAAAKIRFTLLAPHQAKRIRKIGTEKWLEVGGARVDPRQPYLCRLPSGREIALFFYDGPVAQEIAFGGLLRSGEDFARRLLGTFSDRSGPQLVHVATDGETYGHHHRFGDMALAYALAVIEREERTLLTVYGEHLERTPPAFEVEIVENSSWSCAHGVERWRADCGCRIGGQNGWHQRWRAPLRAALDWLRDRLAPLYEREAAALLGDPWEARDEYIAVILDRSPANVRAFLGRRAGRELAAEETLKALRLLEMQRQALLMYTSCGWFFDDLAGIETTQVLAYASRALQLAEESCGENLEAEFVGRLQQAPGNAPPWPDGAAVYQGLVKPMRLDLIRVAVHHAIASEFAGDGGRHQVYCYRAENHDYEQVTAGRMRLALGRTRIRSGITGNQGDFTFAVLHLGGHHLNAGVRPFQGHEAFAAMQQEVREAFLKSDIPGVIRRMDRHFESHNYTLWHLFRDEQRRVLHQIMAQSLGEIESSFQQVYENHFALMRFLREIDMPVPRPLAAPVEVFLNARLRQLLQSRRLDRHQLRTLAREARELGFAVDEPLLGMLAGRQLGALLQKLARSPLNLALLLDLIETAELLLELPVRPDLWQAQNLFWEIHRRLPAAERQEAGDEWRQALRRLGGLLRMSPP